MLNGMESRKIARITIPILLTIAFACGLGGAIWFYAQSAKEAANAAVLVYAQCAFDVLPSQTPAGSSVRMLRFAEPDAKGSGIENVEMPDGQNTGGQNTSSPKRRDRTSFRCTLTNYSSAILYNVYMDLPVSFWEALSDSKNPDSLTIGGNVSQHSWMIVADRIDPGPGNPFVFYAYNEGPHFVSFLFPTKAVLQKRADKERQIVRVKSSTKNPPYLAPALLPDVAKKLQSRSGAVQKKLR